MPLEHSDKPIYAKVSFQTDEEREILLQKLQRYENMTVGFANAAVLSSYLITLTDRTEEYEAMPLHSHSFYEIICCRSSCGIEYWVDSHRYALQKGDIVLIRPGVSHCAVLPNPLPVPYERDVLWIDENHLLSITAQLGVQNKSQLPTCLIRTTGTPWEYLCDMIHQGVREAKNQQEGWELSVVGNTLSVVAHLCRACSSGTAVCLKEEPPTLLAEIIAYIDSHYMKSVLMSDLSRRFFISERSISSLFRKELGTTFSKFLSRRRLIAAKLLIEEGNTLEVVAEKAGFPDYSTFYRAFQKEYGVNPRQYKQSGKD